MCDTTDTIVVIGSEPVNYEKLIAAVLHHSVNEVLRTRFHTDDLTEMVAEMQSEFEGVWNYFLLNEFGESPRLRSSLNLLAEHHEVSRASGNVAGEYSANVYDLTTFAGAYLKIPDQTLQKQIKTAAHKLCQKTCKRYASKP